MTAKPIPNSVAGIINEAAMKTIAVVLGGSKVADKLPVVASLLRTADRILIGGAMASTFLAADGHGTGTSLLEGDLDDARGYLDEAVVSGVELVLPRDVIVARRRAAGEPGRVVRAHAIPADQMVLDIGPVSADLFSARLATARTIFWNGPMGVYELPGFAQGTRAIAHAMIRSNAFTMVGGGGELVVGGDAVAGCWGADPDEAVGGGSAWVGYPPDPGGAAIGPAAQDHQDRIRRADTADREPGQNAFEPERVLITARV